MKNILKIGDKVSHIYFEDIREGLVVDFAEKEYEQDKVVVAYRNFRTNKILEVEAYVCHLVERVV